MKNAEETYVVTLRVFVKVKNGEDVKDNFWKIVDEDHKDLELDVLDVTQRH